MDSSNIPFVREVAETIPEKKAAPLMSWIVVGIALLVLLVLRWCYLRADLWNSDEPQHLHVVWAWANGLIPYRDIFDNHTPLFHILSVPLFRALGERADIVFPMRLAMVPLFLASLWCIYRIGTTVFSPRVGLWAAALLGFFPKYFFMMGQYRTDVLWTVLWLGSLTVMIGRPWTSKRLFLGGLLAGAAFGVSMKTTLLLILTLFTLGLSWIAALILTPRQANAASADRCNWWAGGASWLVGLLVVPALVLAFFACKGALGPMHYCIITHNTLPGDQTLSRTLHRLQTWSWLALLPALALTVMTRPVFATDPARARRQLFLILGAGLFIPILNGFWRMITQQDYMPWYPLLALIIPPTFLLLERWLPRWGTRVATMCMLLLIGGEIRWMLHHAPINGPGSFHEVAAISDALRLADHGEYVMDSKGDLIFHPRPYYYVLETLTRKRLHAGLMRDELPERLTETRTAIFRIAPERLTEASLEFAHENYVSVGNLSVLGKVLPPTAESGTTFDLKIPERYSLVTPKGSVVGTLDGIPIDGPRWLDAGKHEFRPTSPSSDAVLIWSRALERGFSPFAKSPSKAPGTAS